MTIRITGMNSGLDTEAIISELASARSIKVQKIEKNQTKLSWKIDAWKELNTKIYSLYSDVISDMRYDYAYAKKTTKVSNADAVTVMTAGDAMNGVQSMKVVQMAKTGYLTGAKIDASSGEKLLANMEGLDWLKDPGKSVSFKVTVNGEEKEIKLTGYNTINDMVDKFKEVGLEAKFDAASSRFFITSKETGKAANFTLSAGISDALYSVNGGEKSLKKVPAYQEVPKDWADADQAVKDQWQAKWEALDSEDQAKWADAEAMYTANQAAIIEANAERDKIIADNNALIKEAAKNGVKTGFLEVPTYREVPPKQTVPPEVEIPKAWDSMTPAEQTAWWDSLDPAERSEWQTKWDNVSKPNDYSGPAELACKTKWSEAVDANEKRKEIIAANAEADRIEAANKSIPSIIEANNKLMSSIETSAKELTDTLKALGLLTADVAKEYGVELEAGKAATMIQGQDAIIELNGVEFTSNTNTFEINGLTMTVHKETDEVITLTTEQDTSGIYDTIKNFIKKYSELINEMDKLYNAESASKYEPLTKEEKEALSDTEVEEWEKKIKESLLRRDTTLSSVSSALKTVMMQTHIPGKEGFNDGKDIYLSAFGIETLGYFKAKDNEKNAYHINGDPDDTDVKNYEDKLKKAIATDPDTVVEFFKELATNMYNTLEEKMEKTDYSSRYTVYNDIQMASELKEYDSKIATEQKKLNDYIDRWYEKFSQMEVALGKLNSKESSISSLFG